MGIVNVTPDSFSDGGEHVTTEAAVRHALRLARQGADIIDVGGESTRPGAERVTVDAEIRRVVPVIRRLREKRDLGCLVSIDTRKTTVAREALAAGADLVNDVRALRARGMMELVAETRVPAVLMHMLGTPRSMQRNPRYGDVVADLKRFFRDRVRACARAGIDKDALLIDPGIGFGKTVEHNLQILRRLPELAALGRPMLVGASRKSFIGHVLDAPVEKRLVGSLAVAAWCIAQGAQVLRVHDVAQTAQAVRMCDAIRSRP